MRFCVCVCVCLPVHIYTGQLYQQFLFPFQRVMLTRHSHSATVGRMWIICRFPWSITCCLWYIIVATVTIIQLKITWCACSKQDSSVLLYKMDLFIGFHSRESSCRKHMLRKKKLMVVLVWKHLQENKWFLVHSKWAWPCRSLYLNMLWRRPILK